MLCDYRCMQCSGPYNYQCSICTNGFYKWNDYSHCFSYCPTVAINDSRNNYGYGTNVRGEYIDNGVTGTTCGRCSVGCSFCNGPALTDCWSCTAGYKLVDDVPTCTSLFSATGNTGYGPYGPQYMCYDSQCMTSCPT